MDFEKINNAVLASYPGILSEWLPGGKVLAREYVCGSVNGGPGKSMSVNIDTGRWADFAVSEHSGSDPISLYACIHGVGQGEAARELESKHGLAEVKPKANGKAKPEIIQPVPANAPPPPTEHYKLGKPSMTWRYQDATGNLLQLTYRFDREGEKDILPCVYTSAGWKFQGLPTPRPIYGLNRLYERQEEKVVICEGEKCADAADRMLTGCVGISWCGGSKAVARTTWSVLEGRDVLIWPDADEPGKKALEDIIKACVNARVGNLRYLDVDGMPDGWDAGDAFDEGWTNKEVIKWAKPRMRHRDVDPPMPEEPPLPNEAPPDAIEIEEPIQDEAPFRVLGHRAGQIFYLPGGMQEVIKLSAQGHTKASLLQLAPMDYWMNRFPHARGVDWDGAVNALFRVAERVGIFDSTHSQRGRGAWLDDGRAVVHLGDQILVDGLAHNPRQVKSRYVYPADIPIDLEINRMATTEETQGLVDICDSLTWERSLSGKLLAGWLVVSPVCGILKWRPHIWICGPAGSGKTTIMEDVIGRALGSMSLRVDSNTTEAGIRQELGHDARPVLFDEAEAEDERHFNRMRAIINLARGSSAGASIVKGTTGGDAQKYILRSTFCFSSINTSITEFADETRISRLTLAKPSKKTEEEYQHWDNHYAKLKKQIATTLKADFAAALFCRSIKYLDVLQANVETFVDAAAVVLRDRRAADQVGTLLGGLYLCYSSRRVDRDKAIEWIEKQNDWSWHTAIASKSDDEKVIEHLATARVRIGTNEHTVGELISACVNKSDLKHDAEKELGRLGIRVENANYEDNQPARVLVANSSRPLRQLLKSSPYQTDYPHILRSIEGSETQGVTYFSTGLKSRGTWIPFSIFGDTEPEVWEN